MNETEFEAAHAADQARQGDRWRSVFIDLVILTLLWWFITHGLAWQAWVTTAAGTFGALAIGYLRSGQKLRGLFLYAGLGFLAQPTLLGWAAYVQAQHWNDHNTHGWQGFFSGHGASLIWCTAGALVIGLAFSTATRIGEAVHFHWSQYFSISKVLHDWRSHVIAITLAVFSAITVISGPHQHWNSAGWLVLYLVAGWFALGMVDMFRLGWKHFGFSRAKAHPAAGPDGRVLATMPDSGVTAADYLAERDKREMPDPSADSPSR